MIIGFTGTREGLTNQQLAWLVATFESEKATITGVHHGACIGADAAVHAQAIESEIPIHVWPPTNMKACAVETLVPHRLVTVHPRMPYLNRDREIVHATEGLVALPKQDKQPSPEQWGSTWYTVEFAVRSLKRVVICYPNGVVEQRFDYSKREL